MHRLHHNHLYEKSDPDIALHGGYPRGKLYLVKKLLLDLSAVNAWKTYAYFFGAPAINDHSGKHNRPLDDTAPALRRAARRDRWLVVALQFALLVTAALTGTLVPYLLLWVVPALTVLQPILRLRAICEHGAVVDYSSPLTAARTNIGPGWLMWLLFPHHVNYHLEHHIYPSIPHYNLPDCHREMAAAGVLEGAEVVPLGRSLTRVFANRTDPVPHLPRSLSMQPAGLFESQMAMYTSFHRDARNRATHFIGVPAIIVSLMVVLALARFRVGGLDVLVGDRRDSGRVWVVADARCRDWRCDGDVPGSIAGVRRVAGGQPIPRRPHGGRLPSCLSAAGPSSCGVTSMRAAGRRWSATCSRRLIGPMFLMAEIFFALGWRRRLHDRVEAVISERYPDYAAAEGPRAEGRAGG